MLVISRKIKEELKIGENVVVKIIDIDKNQVKLGIEAPFNVPILRMELVDEITKQNKLSSKHNNEDSLQALSELIKGK